MTKFIFKWILVQIKIAFRTFSFYLMTLLLVIGFYLGGTVIKNYEKDIRVLTWAGGSELGSSCTQELVTHSPDGFVFEYADTEESVIEAVEKGNVSCGICFDDTGRNAVIYQSPDSVNGYVVKEIVFSIMLDVESEDWLDTYLEDMKYLDSETGEIIPSEDTIAYTENMYKKYRENMSVDIYDLKQVSTTMSNADKENNNMSIKYILLYLILGLMVVCISLYDCISEDKGFYAAFNKQFGVSLRVIKVLVSAVMSIGIASVINIFGIR